MDEYKAPKAETVYRESTSDTANTTYALVKILKGEAVIENVFINNIPIRFNGKIVEQTLSKARHGSVIYPRLFVS